MSADRRQPAVLVVGAGPVGLTAAHELARRGVPVRLVDAAEGPARTSRAVAVHPRTLETLDQMGTVGPVLRHGRHNRAFTMFAGGRRRVRLEADYASMPTRFPYTVIIEQASTEAVLRAAVARLGVEVEWGVRLTGLDQDATGVRAALRHADGTEERYAVPWLIGCDGGHSTVRKQLGLPLLGESRETWMLADAPVRTELPPDSIYWVHTGGHALMMVPYARDGHWRLLDTAPACGAAGSRAAGAARVGAAAPPRWAGDRSGDPGPGPGPGLGPGSDSGLEAAPGEPDPTGAAGQFAAKLSTGLGHEVRVGEPEWSSVFTFQQRMVERMHEGRVFVAGDAAHVHSPASGQGMNTGIQEAYNLAWKLAMVEQGHAGRELLDSYGAERVPVGEALLGSTRTATFLVQFKNALASVALPVVLSVVRAVRPLRRAVQRKVLGGMSGLRLHYAKSPLTTPERPEPVPVVTPDGATVVLPGRRLHVPAPGERVATATALRPDAPGPLAFAAELRDPRWTLLVAAAAHGPADTPARTARRAAARYGAWLSVRTVCGDGDGVAAEQVGPHPLPDPDGALCRALGLEPGGWALIRPDGYLAAHGTLLTRHALDEALLPVHPVEPPRTGPGGAEASGVPDVASLERGSSGHRAVQDTVGTTVGAPRAERTP
ncbi:FAD-dependent oxidoreductase [Streptomyces sp. NPDC002851]